MCVLYNRFYMCHCYPYSSTLYFFSIFLHLHFFFFFFKQKTAYEIGLGIPAEPLFRSEFTENIINGVERPVKAAELFAFTLRVRAGNTDVLTDAEENVRQKLRAEGVM